VSKRDLLYVAPDGAACMCALVVVVSITDVKGTFIGMFGAARMRFIRPLYEIRVSDRELSE
jgi:hypothetical protein